MHSIRLLFGTIAFSVIGCGENVAGSGASTCASSAEMTAPWTGSASAPVDGSGKDASLRVDISLDSSHPLRTISAIVAPAAGHRAMPERLPWFQVTDEGGGAVDALGTAFETSADVPAYETEHRITLDVSAAAWTPTEGHTQWIRFDSEGGANALAGLEVRGWVCE